MNEALRLQALVAGYGNIDVLKGADVEVAHGEIVALIGANGAGKSTLLNTVIGAVPVRSGRVVVNGGEVTGLSTAKIVRSGIALVPERRQLFGDMSVEENLLLGGYRVAGARSSVRGVLEAQYQLFPVLAERRRQLARSLSGGEQQMLAIARARMSQPRLLLLDEPSLGLAPIMVERIMNLLRELHATGVTVLLVEQNARAALGIADRGYVMETGRIVQEGSAQALLQDARVREAYLGGGGAGGDSLEARIRRLAQEDARVRESTGGVRSTRLP
ncbi:MAG: ABC transporter ATP-binding protein [Burkholderiales bacterium]|nr:ABC transporter ATP-binding protein [Burkholderiales bacterium]